MINFNRKENNVSIDEYTQNVFVQNDNYTNLLNNINTNLYCCHYKQLLIDSVYQSIYHYEERIFIYIISIAYFILLLY